MYDGHQTSAVGSHVDISARLLGGQPGAPDLARALALIDWAVANGFRSLGARCQVTEEGEVEPGAARRLDQLREGARALGHATSFFAAPVVELKLVCDAMMGKLQGLALGPHRVVLVELPENLKGAARVLRILSFNGFQPVVVAPERNPEVRRIPELLRYVLQVGAMCCADVGCLVGLEGHGKAVAARRVSRSGVSAPGVPKICLSAALDTAGAPRNTPPPMILAVYWLRRALWHTICGVTTRKVQIFGTAGVVNSSGVYRKLTSRHVSILPGCTEN